MTTPRTVRDGVRNVMDYLLEAELALFINEVSMSDSRVSFHVHNADADFLLNRKHPGLEQYVSWAESGAYSAMLFDGSLLQVTYDLSEGVVVGHRLAYIPCPYDVDLDLLAEGAPIADIIEIYRENMPMLRSPIRFDHDPGAATLGHPATHMTLNGSSCRIACIAPLHVHRFVDFIFRNFYRTFWLAHKPFFEAGSFRHIGPKSLASSDSLIPHFAWELNAAPF